MSEIKKLEIPLAVYEYVLFYECAQKDWLPNTFSKKLSIKGDGNLLNLINWNSSYSYHPNDSGGNTLFGVTEGVWKNFVNSYPNKGYSSELNSMGKQGWLDVVGYFWDTYSNASRCANYACACLLFQIAWGGFAGAKNLINTLIQNADIKDYPFTTSGSNYKKIADATHAYTDPMVPFGYMRSAVLSHYYNISCPGNKNSVFRVGWLNRVALPFTPYGLYIATTFGGNNVGLQYSSTLPEWDVKVSEMAQNGKDGYVKIFDWGADPASIENLLASSYDYSPFTSYASNKSSTNSSGAYGGCGFIQQLGNYSNAPNANIVYQQVQGKEEVLNTLIGGSYTPNAVKKCEELITSDKKKNEKTKSEQ
jgi:hypothetical protein